MPDETGANVLQSSTSSSVAKTMKVVKNAFLPRRRDQRACLRGGDIRQDLHNRHRAGYHDQLQLETTRVTTKMLKFASSSKLGTRKFMSVMPKAGQSAMAGDVRVGRPQHYWQRFDALGRNGVAKERYR